MIDFYTNLSPNLKSSLLIIIFLMVFLTIMGNKITRLKPTDSPRGLSFLLILLVSTLNDFIKEFYGKQWKRFTPILFAIVIYLAFANTSSLIGLANPLANISIALSFSLFAFLTIQLSGLIVRNPKNRFKDLSSPSVFLMPLNLISEISTPLAMGLRLFGNLLSGSVMMVVIFNLMNLLGDMMNNLGPYVAALGNVSIAAVLLHPIFNIGFGIIQAFVYFMLLTIFLSMAIEEPEIEEASV